MIIVMESQNPLRNSASQNLIIYCSFMVRLKWNSIWKVTISHSKSKHIERMRLSIFHGNFILFSLMIASMYNLIKWCFLKQSVRLIFHKKSSTFFLSLSRESPMYLFWVIICTCVLVRWCMVHCMWYMIRSNEFKHTEYLEVFIHWIFLKNSNEAMKAHFLVDYQHTWVHFSWE